MRGIYKDLIQELADNGIPEMGIPKVDQLVIKDRSNVPLDMTKITMKDGQANGFKNCEATNLK